MYNYYLNNVTKLLLCNKYKMKRGLLILVLAVVALNVNAQTKIAHINSQVLLDTKPHRDGLPQGT